MHFSVDEEAANAERFDIVEVVEVVFQVEFVHPEGGEEGGEVGGLVGLRAEEG